MAYVSLLSGLEDFGLYIYTSSKQLSKSFLKSSNPCPINTFITNTPLDVSPFKENSSTSLAIL